MQSSRRAWEKSRIFPGGGAPTDRRRERFVIARFSVGRRRQTRTTERKSSPPSRQLRILRDTLARSERVAASGRVEAPLTRAEWSSTAAATSDNRPSVSAGCRRARTAPAGPETVSRRADVRSNLSNARLRRISTSRAEERAPTSAPGRACARPTQSARSIGMSRRRVCSKSGSTKPSVASGSSSKRHDDRTLRTTRLHARRTLRFSALGSPYLLLGTRAVAFRNRTGAVPRARLNARLKENSDSYPTRAAISPSRRSVCSSSRAAIPIRQRVK